MNNHTQSQIRGYALALGFVLLAVALRIAVDPWMHERVNYAFFTLAVILAGRFGGFGPSVVALLAGLCGAITVFYLRDGTLDWSSEHFQGGLFAYVLIGTGVVLISRSERIARQAAELSAAKALAQQKFLEREVAERRELEQQLRERQQHLELTLQAGRLGVWSWDLKTNLVQSSDTQEIIHGRTPTGKPRPIGVSDDNIHPDDRSIVRRAIENALADHADKSATYRVIWPDGSIHWVEATGQVMRNEAGEPMRVLGVCADITESKQVELQLRAAEARFRQLADQAPVGIAQSDVDGNTFYVNRQWCELSGSTPEEAMGTGWMKFIHPDDLPNILTKWKESMGAGRDFMTPEFRFVRKDGSVRWAAGSAALFVNDEGKPVGQIGTVLDITDRKLARDELRASQARLQGILDNTTAVVYMKDLDGRYLMVNKQHEKIFHMRAEDIIGRTDLELFADEHAARFEANDNEVVRRGEAMTFEETAPHFDGEHEYISVKFPLQDAAGNVVAVGGISTDISELKRTTEALRAERELLRNLIEVQESEKQFICYEIHDGLIQYVAGTLMSLEGYQRAHASDTTSDVIPKAIANLRRAVDEGRRVIRGVRTTVLNDYGVVAAIDDLIDQMTGAGVSIKFERDEAIDRLPRPIETTIYRVAQESLNNARRHGGARQVQVELHRRPGELVLTVQDDGVGFDARSVRSSAFGVRGMMERVRLLGGTCTIDSTPGQGTRVVATLPVDETHDE